MVSSELGAIAICETPMEILCWMYRYRYRDSNSKNSNDGREDVKENSVVDVLVQRSQLYSKYPKS